MSRIVIDENRCKGCGLCTIACPYNLIQIADRFNAKGYRPAEYIEERAHTGDNSSQENQCIGCANCAAMCPDVAITVYRTRSGPTGRPGARARTHTHADKPTTQTSGNPEKELHRTRNG